MEYIVTNGTKHLVLATNHAGVTSTSSLHLASKFKSRSRAEEFARKYGMKVDAFWGAEMPQGSKFFTTPKQSPINRRAAYRSI